MIIARGRRDGTVEYNRLALREYKSPHGDAEQRGKPLGHVRSSRFKGEQASGSCDRGPILGGEVRDVQHPVEKSARGKELGRVGELHVVLQDVK